MHGSRYVSTPYMCQGRGIPSHGSPLYFVPVIKPILIPLLSSSTPHVDWWSLGSFTSRTGGGRCTTVSCQCTIVSPPRVERERGVRRRPRGTRTLSPTGQTEYRLTVDVDFGFEYAYSFTSFGRIFLRD